MTKRTGLLGKAVQLNADMCSWEMSIAGIMAYITYEEIISVFESGFSFYGSLYSGIMMKVVFLYLSMAVVLTAGIKFYSKLYYRSIYGNLANLYMPVPFSSKELVLSKVITGTATFLTPMLMVLITVFIKGDMAFVMIRLSEIINVPDSSIPGLNLLILWDISVRMFQLNTEVFLAIVFMESLNISEMKVLKGVSFILVIVVFELIKLVPGVLVPIETFNVTSLVVDMIVILVITVFTLYILIEYFDNKYELI